VGTAPSPYDHISIVPCETLTGWRRRRGKSPALHAGSREATARLLMQEGVSVVLIAQRMVRIDKLAHASINVPFTEA
jgi:hypothetical protein